VWDPEGGGSSRADCLPQCVGPLRLKRVILGVRGEGGVNASTRKWYVKVQQRSWTPPNYKQTKLCWGPKGKQQAWLCRR
jgi:hypothetical protein